MKSDLDRLMTERQVDALLVLGGTSGNPSLYYAVDGVGLTNAVWLKRRGAAPHLVYNPMERDEARHTGLDGSTFPENDYSRFLEEHGGDGPAATAAFLAHLLAKHGVTPRLSTPQELDRLNRDDYAALAKLVKDAKIKGD